MRAVIAFTVLIPINIASFHGCRVIHSCVLLISKLCPSPLETLVMCYLTMVNHLAIPRQGFLLFHKYRPEKQGVLIMRSIFLYHFVQQNSPVDYKQCTYLCNCITFQ